MYFIPRNKTKLKVIWIFFGVALQRLVIGVETSNHFLDQSEERPIVTRSRTFSHAQGGR